MMPGCIVQVANQVNGDHVCAHGACIIARAPFFNARGTVFYPQLPLQQGDPLRPAVPQPSLLAHTRSMIDQAS